MFVMVFSWALKIPHLSALFTTALILPISLQLAKPLHAGEPYTNLEIRVDRQTRLSSPGGIPWVLRVLRAYKHCEADDIILLT
jgi:hypothetical protein